jgi:Protein of unknown function (DUF3800)
MFIYLDESGDLGFDFAKAGTSRWFVITLLVCDSAEVQKQIANAVRRTLKNKVNRRKTSRHTEELKGSGTTIEVKTYFYRQLPETGWKIYSMVVDKDRVSAISRTVGGRKQLYNHIAREIVTKVNYPDSATQISLVVDKCKSKPEVHEFDESLSSQLAGLIPLQSRFIPTHEQSCNNPCLQAVDLFCWGIHRKHRDDDPEWYDIFSRKIAVETHFSVLTRSGG